MKRTHICPDEIAHWFDGDEESKSRGRDLALEWVGGLVLNDEDEVWLPELGWLVKKPGERLQ